MPELRKMSESEEDVDSRGSMTPSPINELDLAKHPLQNNWTLWYYKNDRSKGWEENQKEVITFSTVEDFWALYNHIELVSDLKTGCDYSLFKEGIKPMWEDPQNEQGGKWLLTFEKGGRGSFDPKARSVTLDTCWREVMMCLIGEAFGDNGIIVNGAVINIRPKSDKISIWLAASDNSSRDAIMTVGRGLRNRLKLNDRQKITFINHLDEKNKTSSIVKHRFAC